MLIYTMLECIVEILNELNTIHNKELSKGSMSKSSLAKVSVELDLKEFRKEQADSG